MRLLAPILLKLLLSFGCANAQQIINGPDADVRAQDAEVSGRLNAITDVEGIEVGQFNRTDGQYLTGTTVVWAPDQATASVYVGGGWPGTINTDMLDPNKKAQKLDAAFLTGGSGYGLSVFTGIIRWLEEHGHGTQVGSTKDQLLPLVSGAVVYDLGNGGNSKARPDDSFGYAAIAAAKGGRVDQGNVGAGTGTVALGGLLTKGGVGTASVVVDGTTIGALITVNALGTPVDSQDCSLRGVSAGFRGEFPKYSKPSSADCDLILKSNKIAVMPKTGAAHESQPDTASHPNTTIGVIATDAILSKQQVWQLAKTANDGIGEVITPFNTIDDGDTIFAMATDKRPISDAQFSKLLIVVNNVVARAIAHAMLEAVTVKTPRGNFRSYCDRLPSACRKDEVRH
jgi:putative pantetheine hydrolase